MEVGEFKRFVFPSIRRTIPMLASNDIISIQPMVSAVPVDWYSSVSPEPLFALGDRVKLIEPVKPRIRHGFGTLYVPIVKGGGSIVRLHDEVGETVDVKWDVGITDTYSYIVLEKVGVLEELADV